MIKMKSLLIAILSVSFLYSPSFANVQSTPQDPKAYLKAQLADIADLKEQIAVLKKKKQVTKVVLIVSATAAIGGLIITKVASDGQTFFKEFSRDFRVPVPQNKGINFLTVGISTTALSGAAVATSGLLIYLDSAQIANLEMQIDEIQTEITSTLAEIAAN